MQALRERLDKLFQKYKVQPVGYGTGDCITILENIEEFVNELTEMNLRITALTWWCHTKEIFDYNIEPVKRSGDCPHGMGGPVSEYYEGWFSEMSLEWITFETNEEVLPYILHEFPQSKDYLPCLVPALWIKE